MGSGSRVGLACTLLAAFGAAAAAAAGSACSTSTTPEHIVGNDGGGPPPPEAGPPQPPPCGPSDLSSFTPADKPPIGPHVGVCSDAQLTNLIADCFQSSSTRATCSMWLDDPDNLPCFNCWRGPETAPMWAPFVYANSPGETDYINVGGCVALADPSAAACGQAIEAELECEVAGCLSACPVPGPPDAGSGDAAADGGASEAGGEPVDAAAVGAAVGNLYACYSYVDQVGCSRYIQAVNACAPSLADGGPAAFCFVANQNNDALKQWFTLACGGAAGDAGVGDAPADGAPSDAGEGG